MCNMRCGVQFYLHRIFFMSTRGADSNPKKKQRKQKINGVGLFGELAAGGDSGDGRSLDGGEGGLVSE
jgi:hypothetical protein